MKRLIRKAEIDESKFTEEQLKQIKLMREEGFDVELINNPLFSAEQMKTIRCAKEQGIRFDIFCHPNISLKTMQYLVDQLLVIEYWKANTLLNGIKVAPTSDEEAIAAWEKVENAKEIYLHDSYHDTATRNYALVYINGEFLEGTTHAECLSAYLVKQNRENLEDEYYRPEAGEIENVLTDDDVMFFAHVVDDPETTLINDLTGNKMAIYIIPDDYLLKNITLEEAAQNLKQSKKYSEYNIFKDDSEEVDDDNMLVLYQRLAKLNKKQKLLKFLYGDKL